MAATVEEKTEQQLATSEAFTEEISKNLVSELDSAKVVNSMQGKEEKEQKYQFEPPAGPPPPPRSPRRSKEAEAGAAEKSVTEIASERSFLIVLPHAMTLFLMVVLPLLALYLWSAYNVEEIPAPVVAVPRKALCIAKFCIKLPKKSDLASLI